MNIEAFFTILSGVVGIVLLILKHVLGGKEPQRGAITDSAVVGSIKGRDVRLEQIFQTINSNPAAHGPNDFFFSKPAYDELVRYAEELKRKDRDLTAALGRIQQLQADVRKDRRRDRILLALGCGSIGFFLGSLIPLFLNSQNGGALAGSQPGVPASSAAPASSNATVSASPSPSGPPVASASPSVGASEASGIGGPAAESAIEQYFELARQKNPAEMRTLTTTRFVNERSKGPANFDKWWGASVLSVQSEVSPGREPIVDIGGEGDSVWVQVAWRYTTKSTEPMSERKWQLMWFNMVPSKSGYLLNELRDGIPKACTTEVDQLVTCAENDKFVI